MTPTNTPLATAFVQFEGRKLSTKASERTVARTGAKICSPGVRPCLCFSDFVVVVVVVYPHITFQTSVNNQETATCVKVLGALPAGAK